MSLLPYSLARPFLFAMDAETAHEHTLAMLARTQNTPLSWAYCQERVQDPITLAGLKFPNRVGLAAGLDKNAHCIDGLAAMGFGFVEVGTVTPKGQPGNPKPRMFRLPEANALINRLGFNNDGLDAFLANVKLAQFRNKAGTPMLLGLNIGKNAATPIENAADDYLICLDGVYPHADYVTVNISSPNTKNLRELQSDEALDALIGTLAKRRAELAIQHNKQVPVFIKIAPDLDNDQIAVIAATLKRYGTDSSGKVNNAWGVIGTNTTLSATLQRTEGFLRVSVRSFLANERDRERALKRGGGVRPLASPPAESSATVTAPASAVTTTSWPASMTSPGGPQNQAFCATPSRSEGTPAGAPGVPQVRPCSSA